MPRPVTSPLPWSGRRAAASDVPDVVLATGSARCSDAVGRLAAAARVRVTTYDDVDSLLDRWPGRGLVIVGDDVACRFVRWDDPRPLPALGVPGTDVLVVTEQRSTTTLEAAVLLRAERVVLLPDDEAWFTERLAMAAETGHAGAVVGVMSVRGGAGATTTAAALARYSAELGVTTAVVDADPAGDADLRLDVTDEPGLRWPDLRDATGRLPGEAIVGSLPTRNGIAVLAQADDRDDGVGQWSPTPAAVSTVVGALQRAVDLVVVDLPSVTGASHVQGLPQGALLLVATADARGLRAAHSLRVRGALGGSRWLAARHPRRGGLDPGGVADTVGVDLAGATMTDPRVLADHDRGDFVMRRSLTRLAREVLEVVTDAPGLR